MTPLRVALTGATGFLGGHIARVLRASGRSVRAVVRDPSRLPPGLAQTAARADLHDDAALTRAFEGIEVVVANAALGSWSGTLEDLHRTNVGGVENTLRAAAKAGVRRVVLVSSTSVLRTRFGTPIRIGDEPYGHERRPFILPDLTTDWRYAMTKCIGEDRAWALARELALDLVVLRPGPIYGSGDTRFTARLLRTHRRPFAIAPTIGIPLVHAEDVAHTVDVALIHPGAAGHAWLLAGSPVSYTTLLRTLRTIRGEGARVITVPVPLSVTYDTGPAQATLGFAPRSIEAGLREVLAGETPVT